ncbi:hypothetical protein H1P_1900017 [Hyella patelloides LEGE 07179]|uniref:Uncharacterized protein n=1 Tax=Hyella patelloides LEGE 07179 TaxID=945734 RepID=A0A563VP95_9CYAN|nr:hypothetical protein H1P_1900017 [Hyella patelloides LEGE 07179]
MLYYCLKREYYNRDLDFKLIFDRTKKREIVFISLLQKKYILMFLI